MSGYLDDLSPKQEALLAEFKQNLSDVLEKKHDDHLLLQFLRARSFDLKKSEDMFRKHLQWRKQFPEEHYIDFQPVEVMRKYVVPTRIGFDNEGSPVRLVRLGTIDFKGLVSSCKLQDIKDFVVHALDNDMRACKQHNAKFNRHVETRTFVFDLQNLSIRQISNKTVLEMVVQLLKLYEANYPENLKVAYVINIPYFFAWLFNLVKSIVSEDTVKKIKIFGKDGYKEELAQLIDPAIFPTCYGGTLVDPDGDPECPSLFGSQGPIPTSYYFKNQRRLSNGEDGVKQVLIGRRDKTEVDVHVGIPGSSIMWEAESVDQDLDFALFYKKDLGGRQYIMEEVLQKERFGGTLGPSCGTYLCKRAGSYVAVLDNSFSIFRSKVVLYRVSVVPPFSSIVEDNREKRSSMSL